MTITRNGIWLIDEQGNKASTEYFGDEDAARKSLESLKDCEKCINCYGCSDCSDCSRCSGCSDCSDCSDCSRCYGCSDCSDCSRCSRCSRCYGCSGCSDCSGLHDEKDLKGDTEVPAIPVIEGIHQKVYVAASQPNALEMGSWHSCDTTHCRAGWVTHLAGDAGKALEQFHNTELAAMLIYRESSKIPVFPWRFYQSADDAMADMKRCADEEAKQESL